MGLLGLLDGDKQFRQHVWPIGFRGGFFLRAWDVTRWITCICSLLGEQKQEKQGRFGQTEERFSNVRGGSWWFVVVRSIARIYDRLGLGKSFFLRFATPHSFSGRLTGSLCKAQPKRKSRGTCRESFLGLEWIWLHQLKSVAIVVVDPGYM